MLAAIIKGQHAISHICQHRANEIEILFTASPTMHKNYIADACGWFVDLNG
jgi:hypothetical protein